MTQRTTLTLAHDLRFHAAFASGAVQVLDSRSSPEAPSPVEAVLGALGGCTAMDVISILRKQRQEVTGYRVELAGERRAEHPRIFTRIEIVHHVRGRAISRAAVEEAVRLSDTRYCSVHGMLQGTTAITSRIEIEEEPAPASGAAAPRG